MAAKDLGVEPATCVVFEDAPNGVQAGKNAGMKVVAVPSPYVVGDPVFDTADLLLNSLEEYIENESKL
jgi:beta-phosphoglucomutase-like phosphatase (HAD superfamily)